MCRGGLRAAIFRAPARKPRFYINRRARAAAGRASRSLFKNLRSPQFYLFIRNLSPTPYRAAIYLKFAAKPLHAYICRSSAGSAEASEARGVQDIARVIMKCSKRTAKNEIYGWPRPAWFLCARPRPRPKPSRTSRASSTPASPARRDRPSSTG